MTEKEDIVREEALVELQNILNSLPFKKSPRSSQLLSYLVTHSLDKPESPLKGIIIAQDVFGRADHPDSADDTIVRVSAGKLRKMLKLYYYETSKTSNVEISLPTGGYTVKFKTLEEAKEPIERDKRPPLFGGYIKPLMLCAAALIAVISVFHMSSNRNFIKPSKQVTSYPNIVVFPFENLTQDTNYDDLGTAFQRQLVMDLQPFRVVRVQEASGAFEDHPSNLTGYSISGDILGVEPEINLLVTLTDLSNEKVVLKRRVIRDLEGSAYFDLLSEISESLSYNFASPEGELVKLQLDNLKGRLVGKNHIMGKFSAFECYSKVIYFNEFPKEESFKAAYGCLKSELKKNPNDSVLLSELALLENNLAFYAQHPEYKLRHPVFGNIEIEPDVSSARAYELIRKSISIDPGNDMSYAYLGELYFREGDLPKAAHNLKQAVKLNRGNPMHLISYGRILAHQSEWDQSIALCEEAITRSITPDPSAYIPMFLKAVVEGDGAAAEKYLPKIYNMFGTYHQAMYKFVVASLVDDQETIAILKPKLIKNGKRFDGDVLHIMKANGGSDEIFEAFQRELDLRGI